MDSEACTYYGFIEQGGTFYREVLLYDDEAQTQLTALDGKTPHGALLTRTGIRVADFSCSKLDSGAIVWMLPKSAVEALDPGRTYLGSLYLDYSDGEITDRKIYAELTVRAGG